MNDKEAKTPEIPEQSPAPDAPGHDDELITELITGLVSAIDQRYEQHLRSSVMPVAQRLETLAQGFAQMFAFMKRNRRDVAALEAMKCLLANGDVMESKTPVQIAELAYLLGEAMDEAGGKSEKAAADAIREATEALERARRDGSQIQKLEAPADLARRLVTKRRTS